MTDAAGPSHPIAVVARRTGLKPDLIRAWERRYQAVQPQRDDLNRRRYSDRDIARLCLLRDAVDHGRAIGSIAYLEDEQLAALLRDDKHPARAAGSSFALPAAAATLSLDVVGAAAQAADPARLFAALEQAVVDHGVAGALTGIALPLLATLERGGPEPALRRAHAQLARTVIRMHLAALAVRSLPGTAATTTVALAALDDTGDDCRQLAAAAIAADAGWRAVPLGAGLPPEEIAAACAATDVQAVALDAGGTGDASTAAGAIASLRRLAPDLALLALESGSGLFTHLRWGARGLCRVSLDGFAAALTATASSNDGDPPAAPIPSSGVVLLAGDRARRRFNLDHLTPTADGRGLVADLGTVRRLAAELNQTLDPAGRRRPPASAGAVVGAAAFVDVTRRLLEPARSALDGAFRSLEASLGAVAFNGVLEETARRYAACDPAGGPAPPPRAARVLAELAAVWVVSHNPALRGLRELVDADDLEAVLAASGVGDRIGSVLTRTLPLIAATRDMARRHPDDLYTQLEELAALARDHGLEDVSSVLLALDLLREEHRPPFEPSPGPAPAPSPVPREDDAGNTRPVHEPAWAAELVLHAKHTLVWLNQLSVRHARPITRLDQIPDETLAELADDGATGLWLVGLWDRSRASESIKRMMGNPEAAASAYAIRQYRVAPELGGDRAAAELAERAARFGIRLGCDVVANHTGLDSVWVLEHPERFVSRPDSPFPSYTFDGPDLSPDPRIAIQLADQYYDRSDAAVVFRRTDLATGDARYLYHGNDGTGLPWNDTAQLDILAPATRRALVETIVDVARRFPILRFDAAMTLARRHVRRLWYPPPGEGGAIPSRSGHGISEAELDRLMPREFWLEVVEAVEREAPDCLLVAEAFWLMEWHFTRSLGMHRVYHSAFMHLLRDGSADGLRNAARDALAVDPRLLERMVNYLTTPDELPAVEQFGRGNRYFAAATLLATMPGTPLLGHGQVEGLGERYGMEYRRAYHPERPDPEMVRRHRREIAPLLALRRRFAAADGFRLLELAGAGAGDVVAFTNRDPRHGAALVAVNLSGVTRPCHATGCAPQRNPATGQLERPSLVDALGLDPAAGGYAVLTDPIRGGRAVLTAAQLTSDVLPFALGPYEARVLLDPVTGREPADGPYHALAAGLDGDLLPASESLPQSRT